MRSLSKPAKIAVAVVVIASLAFEVVVFVVYRNSTDGQTPVLWVFIALYAALVIGAIRILDSLVRGMRRWLQRT